MLELRGISRRFGTVLANDAVSLTIRPGAIHAIVGENGAGKSTAMRIAYGFYRPDSGTIAVDGHQVDFRSPHDAIAAGIGMVHQHFMLVENMTVTENIILGAEPGGIAVGFSAAAERIRKLSADFGLAIDPEALIEDLSVGQQQRVELLKALYRDAAILILDEPTAVLTPQEVDELFAILSSMRERGKSIVMITHKLSEVLAISDEVTVMRDGKVVGHRLTGETSAAELARLMVGREVLLRVEKGEARPAEVVLSVRDLRVRAGGTERLRGASFDVRAGEIVGIAGVEGNGQTELIEAIAGLTPRGALSGSIELGGVDMTRLTPRQRRELGMTHVPEDRHRRGLLLDFDLEENSILGVQASPELNRGGIFLDGDAVRRRAEAIIRDFDVRPPVPGLQARSLSGGNQQKLVIGRELEGGPKVLLVSQPTRGVDIGAIEFIHRKLIEMRDAGCAILLVSAELEEVTSLSDRLLVIREGEIVGEVDPRTTPVATLGLMMTSRGRASA
ncbi:MAG: ABC transporter ATP-binding protein [Thermoanaerobaculia bacterium]